MGEPSIILPTLLRTARRRFTYPGNRTESRRIPTLSRVFQPANEENEPPLRGVYKADRRPARPVAGSLGVT